MPVSPKKRQRKAETVQNSYPGLTVAELKQIHKIRGIKIPYNATKAQLIHGLQLADFDDSMSNDEPIMTTEHKEETKNDKNAKDSKDEKRSFQTGADPTRKELLTKAEAEKVGFYWAD